MKRPLIILTTLLLGFILLMPDQTDASMVDWSMNEGASWTLSVSWVGASGYDGSSFVWDRMEFWFVGPTGWDEFESPYFSADPHGYGSPSNQWTLDSGTPQKIVISGPTINTGQYLSYRLYFEQNTPSFAKTELWVLSYDGTELEEWGKAYVDYNFGGGGPNDYYYEYYDPATFVPEPATLTLVGLGLVGTLAARRRKKG